MAGSILITNNQNLTNSESTSKVKNSKIYNFSAALPATKIQHLARFRASKQPVNKIFPEKPLQQSANKATSKQAFSKFYIRHTPTPMNEQYDKSDRLRTDPKSKHLEMFMLKFSSSRRWIFHLYDRFHVKANYSNLLQVKVNQQTPIVEWVYKILQAGQCAAILLENNGICRKNLQTIKALCQSTNVALVVIEGRSEKLN